MSGMYNYNFEKEQFMEEYYEMNKKSRSKAYSMWGWLGLFGGHRYYFGKINSAIGQLVFLLVIILTVVFVRIPWLWTIVILPFLWWAYDYFQIAKWLKEDRKELKSQAALKYLHQRRDV